MSEPSDAPESDLSKQALRSINIALGWSLVLLVFVLVVGLPYLWWAAAVFGWVDSKPPWPVFLTSALLVPGAYLFPRLGTRLGLRLQEASRRMREMNKRLREKGRSADGEHHG